MLVVGPAYDDQEFDRFFRFDPLWHWVQRPVAGGRLSAELIRHRS